MLRSPRHRLKRGRVRVQSRPSYCKSQDLVDGVKPSRLISLPAGRGLVGTNKPLLAIDGESPLREVAIQAFEIDPLCRGPTHGLSSLLHKPVMSPMLSNTVGQLCFTTTWRRPTICRVLPMPPGGSG